jgi:flagellar basal-body rod modification protein FlgD
MATTTAATASNSVSNLPLEVQQALQGVTMKANRQTLNQDDFLRLLTVQLQNQDPLKPMEDAQFMGTMAQFASLEQTRELTQTMGDFTKAQILNSAQIYLGRQVTLSLTDQDGKFISGLVSGVKLVGGVPQITIGGKDYATASVTQIQDIASTTAK